MTGVQTCALPIFTKNIALFSSLFLATSFWHINFSRIGFRAILIPFLMVFGFYFLFKGLKTHKIWNFIIAGIIFGLGFYTYISYRFIVLLIPLMLVPWFFIYKDKKKFIKHNLYLAISAFIVALPIGIYFLNNPADFTGRAAGVSIFTSENPLKDLGISLISHLGMFNFFGDFNWRHNLSGSPQLLWPVGILFLIGFFFSIKKLLEFKKNKNWSLVTGYWLLLSWWLIMLLPGFLSKEGVPHALRVIGTIPPAFIFSGIGAVLLIKRIKIKKTDYLIIFALILMSISFIFGQYYKYFISWGENQNTQRAFTQNLVQIGNYLNSVPKETEKYVIVNLPGVPVPFPSGIPMPAQTVMFIEKTQGNFKTKYILPEDIKNIKIDKQAVIIPLKFNEILFKRLKINFRNGKIQKINGISIYKIN